MKRILILDTETTGLDATKDQAIEVAAILYSVEHATVLRCFSSLIRAAGNPCENINRIPPAALHSAPDAPIVWSAVAAMADQAGAFVAHRAEFDQAFTPPHVASLLPWVCSKEDLRWPKQTQERPSLVALALEHDLGVAVAHRALADCDLLARLFTRAHELGADLSAMLARGLRPKVLLQALVSFDDNHKAKAAGFQWDAPTKRWLRRMVAEDAGALPFETRTVAA